MEKGVEYARKVIKVAEQVLRVRPSCEDKNQLLSAIDKHEVRGDSSLQTFLECLAEDEKRIDRLKETIDTIMSRVHPNAVRFVRYDYTISCASWEQVVQPPHSQIVKKAQLRTEHLNGLFLRAKQDALHADQTLQWLTDARHFLADKMRYPLPEDITMLTQLMQDHQVQSFSISGIRAQSEGQIRPTIHSTIIPPVEGPQHHLRPILTNSPTLHRPFEHVDFARWRTNYLSWIKANKLRITDFFRKNQQEGRITRERFVTGLVKCISKLQDYIADID
ncbi:microtubule-actin cross-linking factor 1-like [Octopus sinensis]|uniref:Microtubule-actin cross-linking factor 1-like n=2 Tax=Octopus sinensis TaxID=2607531 RepID=A0A7E6EIQ4_9MOLL|nr:microtubule-actin cross-linking factor 1-like [Octopus sinensis]